MDIYLYYVSVGMICLLFALGSVIYRKISIWRLLILILSISLFIIIEFLPFLLSFLEGIDIKSYFQYYLYLIVLIMAVTFRRKIKITRNLTDYDFFELEKELEGVKSISELLRLRFIHTIGLLDDGLIFYEEDRKSLFLTEPILKILNINHAEISVDEYLNYIYHEDRNSYLNIIKKANQKFFEFNQKYRLALGASYTWVEEKGKIFSFNNKEYLISTIKKLDIKLFPETSIQIVDALPLEDDLINQISFLRKEKKIFYLAMMHLTNIPDINKRFGRDVGNLMIAEYIKQMRFHFAKDQNTIFRITGIHFAVIIDDPQRYAILHRALVSGGDLINIKISIGGIVQMVYPNIGIIKHDPWQEIDVSEFISLANKALDEAIRNNRQNYSIFGGE